MIMLLAGLPGAELAAKDSDKSAQQTAELLQQMTLAEKIGQMTQVDSDALKGRVGDIQKYSLGSVKRRKTGKAASKTS